MYSISKGFQVNDEIRAREVRVISETGEQLGIMHIRDALRIAQERSLDLVRVAANAVPPVCRIMDYGRFKYEQSKHEREARKKQKTISIKEVRMTPTIEDHDLKTKIMACLRFLEEGDKVKATVRFRGREITHSNLGKQALDKLAAGVVEIGVVEREARMEGRNMIMFLAPKNP
ncbi:MAG: translation initiation factor IF-3 [Symbiobacteriaceae bacterium]|nr:translation initiation factor IF-3 [Symbiobacteriaceae bacterium]